MKDFQKRKKPETFRLVKKILAKMDQDGEKFTKKKSQILSQNKKKTCLS